MTGYAMPTTAYNTRALTPREYEDLMYPAMPDGLAGVPADLPLVYADGSAMAVKVRANRAAWLRGLRWESGGTEGSLTIAANGTAGTTRNDLVVLRMTRNPWDAAPAVVQGTATTTPVTPSPTYGTDTSTGVWELPLAVVAVPAGVSSIAATQVTPVAWYIGEDGQILCTSTTRPPHAPGRRIRETDTGRSYESTGSAWAVLLDESGLSGFTLEAGFTATSNVLRRRGGFVTGQLSFRKTGSMNADTDYKVAIIPAGFRPADTMHLIGMVRDLSLAATGSISDSGAVTVRVADLVTAGEIKLHPVTWPVAP